MGRKEAAERGLWRLRDEETRWDLFVPLHRLWLGYMSELLGLAIPPSSSSQPSTSTSTSTTTMRTMMPQAAGMHAKLLKADFHGSIMTVRRSKNATLVGASGIVIQETENTFKVVTRNDKLKVLPKQGSIFSFAVPLYSSGGIKEEISAPAAATTTTTTKSSGTDGRRNSPMSGGGGGEEEEETVGTKTTTMATVLDAPHIEFELYGNQFCFRAVDRASRKFKHKETIEL
ncbi:Rof/RNase P-like protein [Multifurca ochricompacta]|uniref:Rof/RNase P-like protein n=1 Tax=Multifurca ochricompacta TaxID=376703 RepID=A0AAD4QK34_9AGAM|nr:Rof/RNase P-like protein [Multifurca ochricompacta]